MLRLRPLSSLSYHPYLRVVVPSSQHLDCIAYLSGTAARLPFLRAHTAHQPGSLHKSNIVAGPLALWPTCSLDRRRRHATFLARQCDVFGDGFVQGKMWRGRLLPSLELCDALHLTPPFEAYGRTPGSCCTDHVRRRLRMTK